MAIGSQKIVPELVEPEDMHDACAQEAEVQQRLGDPQNDVQ